MLTLILLVTCLSSIDAASYEVIVGRTKVWSDEEGNQGDNGKPTECLDQSRTQGDESNTYGDNIAAQCCRDMADNTVKIGRFFSPADAKGNLKCVPEGAGATADKLCCSGVDYDTAKALCDDRGDRLCTADEVENPVIQAHRFDGSGCSFDAFHVWTSTRCGGHMAVSGHTKTETEKPDACVEDGDTHGPDSNSYGDFMGAQCCQDMRDGSVELGRFFTPRPADKEQLPAECKHGTEWYKSDANHLCCVGVDYCTAKNLCEAEGYRLCTKDEAESNLPRFDESGCNFDFYHIWTSDLCGGNTEPSCGRTDCSAVDIDGYLTRCSNVFDRTLPRQISDLEDEVLRVENAYQAADTLLGTTLRGEFGEADQSVRDDLKTAFEEADTQLSSTLTAAYEAADTASENALTTAYEAADQSVRDDLKALQTDVERRLVLLEEHAELVKDAGGVAPVSKGATTPLIDFNNYNHVLLFSLFANIVLIIFACCMYNKYKSKSMKHYGKVASFVDSDSEAHPLQR